MCIFLYHSRSCHYGLFHSGVLSCIFLDTEILYSDIHSFGFILVFLLLTGKWFCGCYWVSPATSSSSFDFGCGCDRHFSAVIDTFLLCASSTSSIAQFFCLGVFPKAKGADSAPRGGGMKCPCCSSQLM